MVFTLVLHRAPLSSLASLSCDAMAATPSSACLNGTERRPERHAAAARAARVCAARAAPAIYIPLVPLVAIFPHLLRCFRPSAAGIYLLQRVQLSTTVDHASHSV